MRAVRWRESGRAALSGVYAAILFLFVSRSSCAWRWFYERDGRLSQNMVAIIFLLVLSSAWATEAIGIHAMFGAFLIGCAMPKGTAFVRHLTDKLEDFTVVFLLPIFFAYTGLKTQLGLLNDPRLWLLTMLIIAIACAGKFGGTFLPAKLFGATFREATAMGVLMNTRGLVELVILTVGLQFGVINDRVFAIMVIMALVTTFATTPLLYLIFPRRLLEKATGAKAGFTVLIPVAAPGSGRRLVHVANLLSGDNDADRRILALHLERSADHQAFSTGLNASDNADQALRPLLDYAQTNQIPVEAISSLSRDIAADIARTARSTARGPGIDRLPSPGFWPDHSGREGASRADWSRHGCCRLRRSRVGQAQAHAGPAHGRPARSAGDGACRAGARKWRGSDDPACCSQKP